MTTQAVANFAGLRIASLESRRAPEIERMIEKLGGVPYVSPSLREVAIEEHRPAIDFANHLITGQVDIVLFLTGVGIREMLTHLERHVDRQRFLDALADVKTVVRGPKPLAVMRELGLTPTLQVPEPNTWREVLSTFDQFLPVANQVIAVQEYGVTNVSLVAGLEARAHESCPCRFIDGSCRRTSRRWRPTFAVSPRVKSTPVCLPRRSK